MPVPTDLKVFFQLPLDFSRQFGGLGFASPIGLYVDGNKTFLFPLVPQFSRAPWRHDPLKKPF